MTQPIRVLCVVTISVALGCVGDSGESASEFVSRTDSAGIEIVVSSAPAWPSGSEWRLDSEPVLSVGGSDSADPNFSIDRVVGALRLSDGSVAVADASRQRIVYFSADGKFIADYGREGQGPGEFDAITRIFRLAGDTIAVTDFKAIVVVLAPGAKHVRNVKLDGIITAQFVFGDGASLGPSGSAQTGGGMAFEVALPGGDGAHELKVDSTKYSRVGPDGVGAAEYAAVPRFVFFLPSWQQQIFGPSGYGSVLGTDYYHAFSSEFAVSRFDSSGILTRIFRRAWTPTEVSAATTDAYVADVASKISPYDDFTIPQMRRQIEARQSARTLPAFNAMIVGTDGTVWLREQLGPEDSYRRAVAWETLQPRSWTVFDSTGAWLGSVTMPERFEPTEIGAEYITGIWRDSLDVQNVRVHRLIKR